MDGNTEINFFIGTRDHLFEGLWKTTESEYKCGVQFTDWGAAELNNHGANEHCAAINKNVNWK